MTDRSAVDTIRGYFYQFDLSIFSVLQLASPDDSIEIECTEDIDIRTASEITATQCKYYAKTEYNHSVIKDAIKHMVSHFKESLGGTKPKFTWINVRFWPISATHDRQKSTQSGHLTESTR
ncbi:hypothetical protein [Pseudomonas sp. MF6747]|uniref:hypothetical protein n=1 Tax=Pseudomonas sp. MF6747 TaxID=2797527 RepID=UPI001F2DB184|nr:hypothetical protein [Pseudomonas sp. MF6747]